MVYKFPESNVFYRNLIAVVPLCVRGNGIYLYDENGKSYLDGSSGALVVNTGHGIQEIASALSEQAGKVAYVNGLHFTNEATECLADEIVEVMPPTLNKVYFLCSGSEATEAAIKLSCHYWYENGETSKTKIIGRIPG